MSANPLSLDPVLLGMNRSLYVVVRLGEGVLGLEFTLERPGEPAVVSKCKELGDIPGGKFKRDRLFRESIALINTVVQSLQKESQGLRLKKLIPTALFSLFLLRFGSASIRRRVVESKSQDFV